MTTTAGNLESFTYIRVSDDDGCLQTLMEDLPHQMEAYNRFYKSSVHLIQIYIEELEKDSRELIQLLQMTQQGSDAGKFLKILCEQMTMKTTLAQKTLEQFIQRVQNRTLLASDVTGGGGGVAGTSDYLKYVPTNFTVRSECRMAMRTVSDDLGRIADILRVSEDWKKDVTVNSTVDDERASQVSSYIWAGRVVGD